jgi:RNA polymerase sigma-70 factor, ECF subfamily
VSKDLDQRLSELMRRAQDGDRMAYETLLIEVSALVRDFTRRRVRKQDWQEEIVQETLLSLHRDRHTYDPEQPFRPWMYAIARHRLIDYVKSQRRRDARDLPLEAAAEFPSHARRGADGASRTFVRQVFAHLSNTQREVVRMLQLEGFSAAEISARTGLSTSNVKVTAHRAYKRLRALLGDSQS